jgi:putative ABC transport system permease protein
MRVATSTYRLLTHLLPVAFRAEYADAMIASFIDRAGRRSGLRRWSFVVAAMSDLVATAAAERRPHTSGWAPDLSFAVRALRKRPGFSFAVIATLAIGIGANLAVFSLVDAVLLRPLAVASPDHLVGVFKLHKGET